MRQHQAEILTAQQAATRKGCAKQTIHNAAGRGELQSVRIGRTLGIYDDATFHAWEPKDVGMRVLRNQTSEE